MTKLYSNKAFFAILKVPVIFRDQTQQVGRESKTQGASTPDSSTNMGHFTVVPEVISVKPENLYFF